MNRFAITAASFAIAASGSAILLSPDQAPANAQATNQCQAARLICPVAGGCTVNSQYQKNRKHPVTGVVRNHWGVDYAASNGTVIIAASEGVVSRSYLSSTLGNAIILRHGDGSSTLYAHLLERQAAEGSMVDAGQQIGLADSTGLSSGPHLHFEYVPSGQIFSNRRIDPHPCVDPAPTNSGNFVGTYILEDFGDITLRSGSRENCYPEDYLGETIEVRKVGSDGYETYTVDDDGPWRVPLQVVENGNALRGTDIRSTTDGGQKTEANITVDVASTGRLLLTYDFIFSSEYGACSGIQEIEAFK